MLKEPLPEGVLSRDKKTNEAVLREHLKRKSTAQRNQASRLLHDWTPGFLEPEQPGEQTLQVTQNDILQAVNLQTAANAFTLKLDMGNYRCAYSRNGKSLLLTSSQGHCALLDWREKELKLEVNLRQAIRDSTFLHNDQMLALCQESGTFLYDAQGTELHRLRTANQVQYLPYHFLLALSAPGRLSYTDTTTGQTVADHRAKGHYTTMAQNHSNAVVALGTSKGVVEWWTPGIGTPGVEVFVGSHLDAIAFHKGYMFTLADSLKVWDVRMLKPLVEQPLHRRACSLAASQSGLLAVNYGFQVDFYKDLHLQRQARPYLRHSCRGYRAQNLAFLPFQDLAGLGTSAGFSSLVVPGAGVPNYDAFENNPFETQHQQREGLVHRLLEKLPPETITIDPNVLGGLSRLSQEQLAAEAEAEEQRRQKEHLERVLAKNKARGRNKASKKISRKEIEVDKVRRQQLTKVVNSRLWAKRAERAKRQDELALIEQMQSEGLGVADLLTPAP